MLMAGGVFGRRRLRGRRGTGLQKVADGAPETAEGDFRKFEIVAVNEQAGRARALRCIAAPVSVSVIMPMTTGRGRRDGADMRMGRATPAMLDEPVQDGTHPDRARKGETQGQRARDDLLKPLHRNV